MPRLAIYGAGGFGRELLTAARDDTREIVFVADQANGPVLGIPVLLPAELRPDDVVVLAIGDGAVRKRLAALPLAYESLIAPTAIVGPDVELGAGAVICDHVTITASARIGRHFQCNIYSYVAHDCVIGDFVTFAPRVSCNGNVRIGDGAYIGTGAVLRNGHPGQPLVVGAGAVVGMGAVVTKDVAPGVTVVGNPAAILAAK